MMTFKQALKIGYVTKVRKYLFPIINTYPQYFLKELIKSQIVSVGLRDIDDEVYFDIVCKEHPNSIVHSKYIKEVYRSLNLKHTIIIVEILDKWKPLVPIFKEGKYSQLYNFDLADIGIYPEKYNKDGIICGPNYIYHVLRKTEIGREYFYNKLIELNYIDKSKTKFEDFKPAEYDLPPKKYDLDTSV